MAYIKKDVNGILLFLVMLTCIALVTLTVVFANQFDGGNRDYDQLKADLEITSQELAQKNERLVSLNDLLDKHIEREKELERMLRERLNR
ncbi:hypothetical protein COV11_03225 [Candidatus Woesearchaeota archaeon CG10_big_fil_rev_8_21_14_0_10_30_7]|nr:MAG: hypothetical protein COV11_03225 [Candidatus Woesearchaeota archaeon CG10_big_fil_rev_8_21_14_0_10_30_7]